MKSTMILAVVLTLAITSVGIAEDAFTGYVTGNDVYVRSGPSQGYYDLGKVNEGDLLEVTDRSDLWYTVKMPAGRVSYIAKQFVEIGADGKSGTLTGNRVRVRAPSKAGPTIEHSYATQLRLDRGAKVHVVGEAGEFYEITPPPGAMAYVHVDYIRRATPAEIAAAKAPARPDAPTPATVTEQTPTAPTVEVAVDETPAQPDPAPPVTRDPQPLEPREPEVATQVRDEPAPSDIRVEPTITITPQPDATTESNVIVSIGTSDTPRPATEAASPDPALTTQADTTPEPAVVAEAPTEPAAAPRTADEQLADLESRFATVSGQPLADQPVDRLIADYRALKATGQLDEHSVVLVDTRIELLETRAALQDALANINDAPTPEQRPEAATTPVQPPRNYDAVGRLIASTLYTGERLPLLYRLIDPMSGLTIGYIEPQQDMDLNPLLGRLVGVQGQTRYHPGLKLRVITAVRADALGATP